MGVEYTRLCFSAGACGAGKDAKVSSVALTKMYLARLKKYDPQLHFVITLTEERAMEHAAAADKEIAAGNYRGRCMEFRGERKTCWQ